MNGPDRHDTQPLSRAEIQELLDRMSADANRPPDELASVLIQDQLILPEDEPIPVPSDEPTRPEIIIGLGSEIGS